VTEPIVPPAGPAETPEAALPSVAPEAAAPVEPRIPGVYRDEDLVYVDPDQRKVVGFVEFNKAGNPKPLLMKVTEEEDEEEPKEEAKPVVKGKDVRGGKRPRVRRQRFYPWGTYRSMKRIYKIEGKIPREENQKTLDEVMEKALKEPFWD
jgi:hypothetical protein